MGVCALSFTCVSLSLTRGSPSSRVPEPGQLRKMALTFPSLGLKVYLVGNGEQKGMSVLSCKFLEVIHKSAFKTGKMD